MWNVGSGPNAEGEAAVSRWSAEALEASFLKVSTRWSLQLEARSEWIGSVPPHQLHKVMEPDERLCVTAIGELRGSIPGQVALVLDWQNAQKLWQSLGAASSQEPLWAFDANVGTFLAFANTLFDGVAEALATEQGHLEVSGSLFCVDMKGTAIASLATLSSDEPMVIVAATDLECRSTGACAQFLYLPSAKGVLNHIHSEDVRAA